MANNARRLTYGLRKENKARLQKRYKKEYQLSLTVRVKAGRVGVIEQRE
jgi:hypothetical protein